MPGTAYGSARGPVQKDRGQYMTINLYMDVDGVLLGRDESGRVSVIPNIGEVRDKDCEDVSQLDGLTREIRGRAIREWSGRGVKEN